jgi:hypothetical protein
MAPETGWRRQTNAPIHLSDINPEPGLDISLVDPRSFFFHGSGGEGERGYVIDKGYRLEHNVCRRDMFRIQVNHFGRGSPAALSLYPKNTQRTFLMQILMVTAW